MPRFGMLVLLLLLASCRSGGEPTMAARSMENADPHPPGAEPNWVHEDLFYDPSEGISYAVGRASMGAEALTACPKDSLLLKRAEAAARERLTSLALSPEAVRGAEVRLAWFDGRGGLYVVAGASVEAPEGTKHLAPKGGAAGPAAIEAARAAIALELRRSGVCADPHRRAEFPCCGSAKTFCSDPTRFDRTNEDGTCACGEHEPCLHDFRCEARQGEKKCICRGARCPCAPMIQCKDGQTCQNGRCF